MWEYFKDEYESVIDRDYYLANYMQKFSSYSEEPFWVIDADGFEVPNGINYIRLGLTDKLPNITIKYNTTGNRKYFDTFNKNIGTMTFCPYIKNIEGFTITDFKRLLKLVQRSEYPIDKCLEIIECLRIQSDCYLWYLQVIWNVRRKMCDYLANGIINAKTFKRNIKILKRTFDRYKKIKNNTVKVIDMFKEVVNDV